jgi:diguanylate cyclase (GGDEF)-like protein
LTDIPSAVILPPQMVAAARSGGETKPAGGVDIPLGERLRLLSRVPLFRQLAPEQVQPLVELAQPVLFQAGEVIMRQSEPGDSVFIVVDGAVEVRAHSEGDPDAPEAVVATLATGATVGELALLDGRSRSATCIAIERTRCLVLRRDEFLTSLRRHWPLNLALLAELSERLRIADALLAEHARDPLTGLDNRRALGKIYLREAARLERAASQPDANVRPLALLFADVDRLKRINDEHGHVVGDEVLRAAAAMLTAASRVSDVVIRYGGDEFIVLMPDTTLDGAEAVANRVREAMRARPPAPVPFTMSLGTAVVDPQNPSTLEGLIAQADARMYLEKARVPVELNTPA